MVDETKVEVEVGAKTDTLGPGLSAAASTVDKNVNQMTSSVGRLATVGRDAAGRFTKLAPTLSAVAAAADKVGPAVTRSGRAYSVAAAEAKRMGDAAEYAATHTHAINSSFLKLAPTLQQTTARQAEVGRMWKSVAEDAVASANKSGAAAAKAAGSNRMVVGSLAQTDAALKKTAGAHTAHAAASGRASEQVVANFGHIRTSIGTLHGRFVESFGKMQGAFVAFAAALAGGALFKEYIQNADRFTDEVHTLSATFGIASGKATDLNVALRIAGVGANEFENLLMRFEQRVRSAGDELSQYGVNVKGMRDGTRGTDEEFLKALNSIERFREGTNQLEASMAILGSRVSPGVREELKRLTQVKILAASEFGKGLGLKQTEEDIERMHDFHDAIHKVELVFTGLSMAIAREIEPRLTHLAEWFADHGPEAIQIGIDIFEAFGTVLTAVGDTVKGFFELCMTWVNAAAQTWGTFFGAGGEAMTGLQLFRNMLKVVEIAVVGLKVVFMEGFMVIKTILDAAVSWFQRFANIAQAALNLDFSGMQAAWTAGAADLEAKALANVKRMVQIAKDGKAQIDDIVLRQPTPLGPKGGHERKPGGTDTFTDKRKKGGDSDERLALMREALQKEIEAKVGYFNDSKDLEIKFWEDQLKTVQGGSAKDIKLRRQIEAILYQDRKSAANKQLGVALQLMDQEAALATENLDTQIRIAQQQAAIVGAYWDKEPEKVAAANAKVIALQRQKADMLLAIEAKRDAMSTARLQTGIDAERASLDFAVAMGQVSQQQRFAIESEFEERSFNLHLGLLQRKRAADLQRLRDLGADDDRITEAKMTADAEIEDLEAKHQGRMTEIKREAAKEAAKFELAAVDATRGALSGLLADLQSGTKGVKQSFQDMVFGLKGSLDKLVADQFIQGVLGPGTAGGGMLHSLFGGMFGTGGGGTDAKAAGIALSSAAVDLTAAAAALMGSAQAGAAGGAAGGVAKGIGGFFGKLFGGLGGGGGGGGGLGTGETMGAFVPYGGGLASGTNYVPRDMTAMLHEGEAVVPKEYNRPGGRGGGVVQNNTFVIQGGIDSRTQNQIAARNSVTAQRAAYRTL